MSDDNTARTPAFPTRHNGTGMTMRDYFAAHASQEDLVRHISKGFKEEYVQENHDGTKSVKSRFALWTDEEAKFIYADAMIKARTA